MAANGPKLEPRNLDREMFKGGGITQSPEGPVLTFNLSVPLKLKEVLSRMPTDGLNSLIRLAEEELVKRPDGRR